MEKPDYCNVFYCKAICCRLVPIIADLDEVKRLADYFSISPEKFVGTYTEYTRFIKRRLVNGEDYCVFMGDDYRCVVYEVRPQACKDYYCTLPELRAKLEAVRRKSCQS